MNDLVTNETTMTVKEIAEVLGVAEITIQKKVKELFPELVKNGVATRLDKYQVQEIKENLVPRNLISKYKVDSAVTELDIERMTAQVLEYHINKAKELEADNKRLQSVNRMLCADVEKMTPKAEVYYICCTSDNLHEIGELGKKTGIGERKIFSFLVADEVIKVKYVDGVKFYEPRYPYDKYFDFTLQTFHQGDVTKSRNKLMLTTEGFMYFSNRYRGE